MASNSGFGTFLELLQIILRRKKFILLSVFIPTLASIVFVMLAQSMYQSDALVDPPREGGGGTGILEDLGLGKAGGFGSLLGGSDGGLDECISILQSTRFAELTVARFDLETAYGFKKPGKETKYYKANVLKSFRRMFSFSETDEGAIRLAMKDTSAVRARDILVYTIHLLDSLYTDVQQTAAHQRLGYIDQRLVLAEADMKRLEDSLSAFQNRHNLLAPDVQLRAILENATQTELRLEAIKEEMAVEAALRGTSSARYADLAVERKLQEKALAGRIRNAPGDNSFILPTKMLPSLTTEYLRLERAYNIRLGVYKYLVQQAETLRLEAGKNIRVISVIDPPWVNDKRVSPRRRVVVESVFVLSLIFSVFLTILQAAWARHKETHPDSGRLALELRRNLFRF